MTSEVQNRHSTPRATDRGLSLVSAVADAAVGISLADAARAAALNPSTALRQLRALEGAGFARRDAEALWHPGPELLRIARLLAGSATLPLLAVDALRALAECSGESAYLAEPHDTTTARYTAMHQGVHTVRHVSWLGHEIPRRGTALGSALSGRVDKASGVAERINAVEDGTTAVSAPVRDASGAIVAALSVVGPSYRFTGKVLVAARAAVRREAAALSRLAGATASPDERTPRARVVRNP